MYILDRTRQPVVRGQVTSAPHKCTTAGMTPAAVYIVRSMAILLRWWLALVFQLGDRDPQFSNLLGALDYGSVGRVNVVSFGQR